MKLNLSKKITLILFSSLLFSCSNPLSSKTAYLNLNVDFPKLNSFSTKVIPKDTESFEITITGKGIDEDKPIKETISKSNSDEQKSTLKELPIGDKKIIVIAFDKDKNTLANAEAEIEIKEGINTVTVELKEILKDIIFEFNNINTSSPEILSSIKFQDGKKVSKLTTEKTISYEKPALGKAEFNAVLWDNELNPIGRIKKDIEIDSKIESYPLNFEPIKVPEELSVEFNSNSKPGSILNNALERQKATQLITNLITDIKELLVEVDGNSPPSMDGIDLKVNGESKTFNLLKSTDIEFGSEIELNIKASDKDGDKIRFIWGMTRPTNNNTYKMKIDSTKGSSLKFNSNNFEKGSTVYLGFVMIDKKSLKGPFTIPLVIR